MQQYYVDLDNRTDRAWTMAVYRTIPKASGPDGGEWKRTQVPPLTTGGLAWGKDPNAPRSNSGQYKPSRAMEDDLEKEWNIVYRDGVQQLRSAPPPPGMERHNVPNNASTEPGEAPAYWVGLFRDVRADEPLGGNMDVGPIELRFPQGSNAAVIDIAGEGDSITHGTTYTRR